MLRERPDEVYGGLLTTLMRLVFVLYAEDRGLLPTDDVYRSTTRSRPLRAAARGRRRATRTRWTSAYGAWAQLLTLFRLVHDGGGHGGCACRRATGACSTPTRYPFLEGRRTRARRERRASGSTPPRVSDGVVFRVLRTC